MTDTTMKTGAELINEILACEPSQAYISICEEEARLKERLAARTGFFWRRSALTESERARDVATLKMLQLAKADVIGSLQGGSSCNPVQGMSIKATVTHLDL